MNTNVRLILELIAQHGELEVPDLRSLTLVSKELTVVRQELANRRLIFDDGEHFFFYYINMFGERWYNGTFIRYFCEQGEANFVRRTIETYRDGTKHGPTSQWFANGECYERGQFENGRISGTWSRWTVSGTVLDVKKYRPHSCGEFYHKKLVPKVPTGHWSSSQIRRYLLEYSRGADGKQWDEYEEVFTEPFVREDARNSQKEGTCIKTIRTREYYDGKIEVVSRYNYYS